MKKSFLTIATILCASLAFAQSEYVMNVFLGSEKVYSEKCEDIDSIKASTNIVSIFEGEKTKAFVDTLIEIQFEEIIEANDTVMITYGESVDIVNPYPETILFSVDGNYVSVNCVNQLKDVVYKLSGSSEDGYFAIESPRKFEVVMDNLSLKSLNELPPIRSFSGSTMEIILPDGTESYLEDSPNDTCNAALRSKGQIVFSDKGNGQLTVNGKQKRAIQTGDYLEINGGKIIANSNLGDAVKANDYFIMNNGSLTVTGYGIEVEKGYAIMNGGIISCTSNVVDLNMFKVAKDSTIAASDENGTFTMNGGELILNVNGSASKGIKAENDIIINGGIIKSTVKGGAIEVPIETGFDASYAATLKADNRVVVQGGEIDIVLDEVSEGSRGITADNAIIFDNGAIIKIEANCTYFENYEEEKKEGHGLKTDGSIIFNDCLVEIVSTDEENSAIAITAEGDEIQVNEGAKVFLSSYSKAAIKGKSTPLTLSGGIMVAYSGNSKALMQSANINNQGGYYIGIGGVANLYNTDRKSQYGYFADQTYPTSQAFQVKDANGNVLFTFSGMDDVPAEAFLQVSAKGIEFNTDVIYNLGGTVSGGTNFHGFSTDASYSGGVDYTVVPAKLQFEIVEK